MLFPGKRVCWITTKEFCLCPREIDHKPISKSDIFVIFLSHFEICLINIRVINDYTVPALVKMMHPQHNHFINT